MTPVLQIREYRLLRELFDRLNGSKEPLERIVRQKLTAARLRLPGETAAPLIRLGSCICFRIADGAAEERMLVLDEDYRPDGRCLTLCSPLGVALLGYQAGDIVEAEWSNECVEPIAILAVRNPPQPAMALPGITIPFPLNSITRAALACPGVHPSTETANES